jgi:SagB-type dehydrogenase family enzyme
MILGERAMKNHEINAAWDYHNGTKHSYESVRASRHYLDWENQPMPFKVYTDLERISLPEHLSSSGIPALEAIAEGGGGLAAPASLTLQMLAEILFLSAGITRRRSHFGGEMLFRAAACTGALYHIDLYLVCSDLEGLEAGVYQFSPQDFSLRRLRSGDYRSVVVGVSGGEPRIAGAPCMIVSASTFWRNAWKYQTRAYRHCYWDNGTILANLLAAAAARKIPAKVVLGFVDTAVNGLLALDEQREGALSIVALGGGSSRALSSPIVEMLAPETLPLSKTEIDYPKIRAMHEASSLKSEEDVAVWRKGREKAEEERIKDEGKTRNRMFPLQPSTQDEAPRDSIEDVIVRRGSSREFARVPISFTALSIMIDRATRGIDSDFRALDDSPLNELYLIVHEVEGLPAGAYVFRRRERALELLKEGDFRREAGELGLGQAIPADCSVNVYFLADLRDALARFGNRGYRAAQFEAAVMGGKLYLAAYAQRLGASGLTFFDDDVTAFFSPDAAGQSVMFLIALGKTAKRQK